MERTHEQARRTPSRVRFPAYALLFVGVLGLLGNCVCGLGVASLPPPPDNVARPPGMTDEEFESYQLGAESSVFFKMNAVLASVCAALIVYPIVIAGAVGMVKLRWFPLAWMAALFALLPCSLVWVIGLPVGVWTMVVLSQTDVKAAFFAGANS